MIERIVRPALTKIRELAATSPGVARGYAEDLERTLRATAEMWAQRAAQWTAAGVLAVGFVTVAAVAAILLIILGFITLIGVLFGPKRD